MTRRRAIRRSRPRILETTAFKRASRDLSPDEKCATAPATVRRNVGSTLEYGRTVGTDSIISPFKPPGLSRGGRRFYLQLISKPPKMSL